MTILATTDNAPIAFGGVMLILVIVAIAISLLIVIVWTIFPFVVWHKFDEVLKQLKKMERGSALVVACVLIALSGCVEPSLAPSDADTAAKSLSTTPGKARIYVYRPSSFYGASIKLPTFLDNQLVGQPTVGTFLLLEVSPATYTLTSSNINSQEVSFSVHSGEAVFFRQHPGFGGGVKYDRVSTAEGLAEIQKLQRVTSHFNSSAHATLR